MMRLLVRPVQILPVLIFLAYAAGDLTYLPYMDDGEDLLSLYDGTQDRYLGLKIASDEALVSVKQDLAGGWKIEDHVVRSESDYSSSFNFDAEGQANVLLRLISGKLRAIYSIEKFGSVEANSVIGLVVIERKTREDFIDPCAKSIYENVYGFSTYPNNLQPTQVVVRKKYKLRVELAFKFHNRLTSSHEYSNQDFGVKLEQALALFLVNAQANSTVKSSEEDVLEQASVIIRTNGNIPMKSPNDFGSKQALVRYLIKHVQETNDVGSITEIGLEDYSTFSVCLGLEEQWKPPIHFHASHTALLRDVARRLQLSQVKMNSFYNDFETFKDCFSQAVTEQILHSKTLYDKDLVPLQTTLLFASIKFKNGSYSELQFLADVKVVGESLGLINIAQNSSSRLPESTVALVLLYKDLELNGISCWPVERKQLYLGAEYNEKIVRFFAVSFSNGTLVPKQQLKLQQFSAACHDQANIKCHILDCQHFQATCNHANGSEIIEFDTRKVLLSNPETDKFVNAVVFNYKKSRYMEYIIRAAMINIEKLKELSNIDTKSQTQLPKLNELIRLLEPANESFSNPIEILLGKPIVPIDGFV